MNTLFLHGFLGSPLDWQELLKSYKEVAASFYIPPHNASFDCIVGYSMGGRKALAALVNNKIKTRSLVLIGVHPGLRTQEEQEEKVAFEKKWLSLLEKTSVSTFLEHWYAQPLFQGIKEIPAQRFLLSKEKIKRTFLEFSILKQPPFWDFLQQFPHPLLYIAGEKDEKYKKIACGLKSICPQMQIAFVKEASHAVHLEKPKEVATLLQAFASAFNTRLTYPPPRDSRIGSGSAFLPLHLISFESLNLSANYVPLRIS